MTALSRLRSRVTRSPAAGFTLQDAAELTGLLAALSRSGLPPTQVWQLLAAEEAAISVPAQRVSAMLAVGGSVPAGLRVAASQLTGSGVQALLWLSVSAEATERAGAPAAGVYAGLVQGINAELEQSAEAAAALSGPRATALVLGLLPVAGAGLGLLMGVNTPAILAGTGPGRVCLGLGLLFWLAGHRWITRLLASAGVR